MNDLVSVELAGHTGAELRFAGSGGALETRSMTRPDLCRDGKGNGSLNIPDEFLRYQPHQHRDGSRIEQEMCYKDRFSST